MVSSCSIILQDDIVATVYQYSYKIIISPDLKQVYVIIVCSCNMTNAAGEGVAEFSKSTIFYLPMPYQLSIVTFKPILGGIPWGIQSVIWNNSSYIVS